MSKQILFNEEARHLLKKGIDKVANAVKITLGPRGRNVAIDKGYGTPTITNDGVTIAKEISLSNKVENLGAEIIKEVAEKTNETAGDGTTTAVVLAQSMIEDGFKRATLGVNPMGIRLGIEAACKEVVDILVRSAKPIKDKHEIIQVATIASESAEFGHIIADAIDKVGKDGVVTVEESQTLGIESELTEGFQLDKGYVSPYMVTKHEHMEAEYSDPYILITDKKISAIRDILPLLEKLASEGKKELVIIADDVDGEALATLVINKIRGAFSTLAVKAPGYGDRKKEMLEDIAIMTGGRVISEEVGLKLESVTQSMLGRARKVIATKDNTTIVGGKGKKTDIESRVAQIRTELDSSDSKFDKEKLEERLGKLSGGVVIIKVGAATETEMKYIKFKIEDAVEATKAAVSEGIVQGGGAALIAAGSKVAEKTLKAPSKEIEHEFQVGVQVLLRALEAPLKQIVLNTGREDASVVIDQVKKGKGNEGYDAVSGNIVDMLKAGIIDPVKVTRNALQNAASAAGILLTTEAAIADEPKKEEKMTGAGMGGGHGMGDMDY